MKLLHILPLFFVGLLLLVSCSEKKDPIALEEEEPAAFGTFNELLTLLEETPMEDREALAAGYMDTLSSSPIIVGTEVYFVYYKANATSVAVAGDFNGWSGYPMERASETGLWYLKLTFESNARLDYKLITNGSSWILDPRNPHQVSGGFGPNSELAMPGYEQPWEIKKVEGTPEGTLVAHELASSFTGKTYPISVYLPAGYETTKTYPVAYFQDGGEYLSLASAATILDNLIATQAIVPTIGVFVTPTNRNEEYAGSVRFKYCDFFVKELVPYIDELYSTQAQASRRAVIGDSYGGNISAIISFANPEVFGNCGLHSGAFQEEGFATNNLVTTGVKLDIRVASVWGSYEYGLYDNMQYIRDYLIGLNYDIIWKELPEGHSWGLWRATTDDMLIYFFAE